MYVVLMKLTVRIVCLPDDTQYISYHYDLTYTQLLPHNCMT
jgi:hypothetical protein